MRRLAALLLAAGALAAQDFTAGDELLEKRDLAGAVAAYTRAIEKKPWIAEGYVRRAFVYINAGDDKKALADLDKALRLDEGHAKAYMLRADVYLGSGRYKEAIGDFDRALQLDEKLGRFCLRARGEAKFRVRDLEGAVADFTRAIELEDNVWNHVRRGRAYEFLGRWREAVADFTRATELAPNEHEPWRFRALAQQKLGRHEAALKDFEAAIFTGGKAPRMHVARARSRLALGDEKGAEADLAAGAKLYAELPAFLEERARYRFDQGRLDAAIADYAAAVKSKGVEEYTWLYLHVARRRAGKEDTALKAYLEKRTEKRDWFAKVGRFLTGTLSEEEFLIVAKHGAALTRRERECEAFFYVGVLHLADGNEKRARHYFRRVLNTELRAFMEYQSATALLR